MSYSTNNSTAISVANFGVRMDGVTDNRVALQGAINSLYPKGGGSLYFPDGTCFWSGTVDITGKNIRFFSDGKARLQAVADESVKKFNVSGANNIRFDGLIIDAGRTGSAPVSNQHGFISTINSDNISITNCSLFNSINSLVYLGGGTRFANITNNYFTGHFCSIYSYVNLGENKSEKFVISSNRFGESWITGDVGESACIKLQANPTLTGVTNGHIISNNAINSSVEMGIELWKGGIGNVISNNTVKNTFWGISIDQQEYCSIVGNSVAFHPYAGIEVAAFSKYSSIVGNTVNGYTSGINSVTRGTQYPIIVSNVICENTVISDNIVVGGANGIFLQTCENTNLNNNIIRDCGVSLDLQSASLVKAHGNSFQTGYSATIYHVFFDAASRTLSGFHFTNNKFGGATTNQSIFFYNPTGFTIQDVCFENNFTDVTTAGGFGAMVAGGPIYNYVFRNNFGPSGLNASNSILDASDLTPYQTPSINNGFSYYNSNTYVVPSGGITGNGIWVCLWSGGGGDQNNVRINVSNDYRMDGNYNGLEFWATMSPYASVNLTNTLYCSPSIWSSTFYKQAKTLSHDTSAITNSLWMKLAPTTTGAFGAPVTIRYSKPNGLAAPYATYTEPADTTNNAKLVFDNPSGGIVAYPGTYKFGGGISLGSSGAASLNTSRSGVLQLYAPDNYVSGPMLSFGKRIANTSIALYDDLVGPTVYGLGIAPNQMRFHVDTSASRFGFFDAPSGNELVTIKGDGSVGIGTVTPTGKLVVEGIPDGGSVVFRSTGRPYVDINGGVNSYRTVRFSDFSATGGYRWDLNTLPGNDANPHAFGFYSQAIPGLGGQVLTLLTGGNIGIGVFNPSAKLHINGSLCLSGIATSTTANVGTATLPANPVGFVTINITGSNFKIPYYNI